MRRLVIHLSFRPCVHVQDAAEAIEQLAVYPPGREALLQDPTVLDALREVAEQGWTDEAKEHAAGALMALSDHQPDVERALDLDQRHLMMSCETTSLCFSE